jgi:hypothetical protein
MAGEVNAELEAGPRRRHRRGADPDADTAAVKEPADGDDRSDDHDQSGDDVSPLPVPS